MPEHPASPGRPGAWVGAWSERRASLTPDRIGLVDQATGRRFTYAELDRRANRVARVLERYGVTAAEDGSVDGETATDHGSTDGETATDHGSVGGRVAVVSRNRPEVVDLFFATGKTGGVLAPLSHRLAPPELRELLATVDPQLLVVEEPFEDLVATVLDDEQLDVDCPVLGLPTDSGTRWESFEQRRPAEDGPVETARLSMDDAHLLLHTGGSTGTPKETVLTHGSIVWNSLNTITAWGLRETDLTPLTFPLFHTGGWNVISVPLWHLGGTVVIDRSVDPGEILEVIDSEGATVLVAVPAVLRSMTTHDDWASTDLSSLRFVKSGGGPCREAVMQAWWDREVDLSQGYGLTECGPNNFAMPEGWPRAKADSVGKPAPHVEARIVEDGEPVSVDEIGELELAGPHAASRYWKHEDATEATFGDGWVSTGDLARVDADGYYFIEGRTTDMFVSGGENVYPAEVEGAIATHPAVAEVVVVPVADEQWGQVGKAVIEPAAPEDAATLDLESLRAFLDDRLARFKHPRHLALVDAMPTSGPSKLDRSAVARRFGDEPE